MKFNFRYTLLLLFVVGLLLPTRNAIGQDTLVVQWSSNNIDPVKNNLFNAIKGDTNADGTRKNLNRVYKLLRDGIYWNTERIENSNFVLRLVAEPYDAAHYPAVIQMVARADNSVDGRIITGQSGVVLKNIWLTGRDNNGVQTYYQPYQMEASNTEFTIDNCFIEQSNFALIAFTGTKNKISFTNTKFRNLMGTPATQQWEGRGISIWADQKEVIVENCTFFNVEFTPFQLEGGAADYIRFNHNTIVNSGRQINVGNWFREAYFANCLIVNGFWHGEGPADINSSGRDPRATQSGLFSIGALPSIYGPEEGRRVLFANMRSYLDPTFTAMYGDTIRRQYYINRVTKEDFLDKYSTNMKIVDTLWLANAPAFPTYAQLVSDKIFDSMKVNITQLRAGVTPATNYYFKPAVTAVDIPWPLPENFTYTDASLMTAGTDGLPLGDLNWFPTQKATFEANKANYVKAIQDMAGPYIVLTVDSTSEAETATLSGSSAVETFTGFSYFQMDGGGFMQWNFNLANAGQYDMNVWTHMRGNDTRGQRTFLNGISIHDSAYGYGELIYSNSATPPNPPNPHAGMPLNAWTWVLWKKSDIKVADQAAFNFPAGANTIRIEPSWGYQNFAGIDLLTPGTSTVVKSLRAPDVTSYAIVAPIGEGSKWTPQGFKSVKLGASGTIAWSLNAKTAGTYRIQVFHRNVSGSAQVLTIKDGATTIASPSLPNKADSTGGSVLSASFTLSAGNHAISISGGNVNVDYIQLVKQTTDVSDDGMTVYSYQLEQNYPNPFNPSTMINFSIAKTSNVRLTVYNILGQNVATLVNNNIMNAGLHSVQFNAARMSTGVYFYKIEAGDFVSVKKMLFLK